MKPHLIVKELEAAARQLGLSVRMERGHFRGGYCVIDDEALIVLNKRHPPEMQLAVLAEGLREHPIDTVFLRPAVRRALEAAWARRAAFEDDPTEADAS